LGQYEIAFINFRPHYDGKLFEREEAKISHIVEK